VILRGLIRLLSLAALAAAGWWLARAFRRKPQAPPRRPAAPAAGDATMVRDRVCNSFLPRSSAIVERIGDEPHYFCSEACRRRFLQAS
jgi:YHS domain-containing protein